MRILPGLFSSGTHWLDVQTKDRTLQIPKFSRAWDIRKCTMDSTKRDPYHENRGHFTSRGKEGTGFGIKYFLNVIIREEQESEPKKTSRTPDEKKTGFKDVSSRSWTPVKVLSVPPSVMEKLQKLERLNVWKSSKTGTSKSFDLSDPVRGRDVLVMFDPENDNPGAKWDVQLADDRGKLTDEEREFLFWDIESALERLHSQESEEDADQEVTRLLARKNSDDDPPPTRGKKVTVALDDDDDDDEDEDDLDLDEDDDLDDLDDEDEDEEEDDEDDDLDDLDDEDEDEDDDLDDEEDDEDEEDEPAPKKRKKKPVDDEDDDDLDF